MKFFSQSAPSPFPQSRIHARVAGAGAADLRSVVLWSAAVLAVLLIAPLPLGAQDPDPDSTAIRRMLNDAGRALSARNAARFLSYFEQRSVKQYARLETHVAALTAQADIASSIRISNWEPQDSGYRGTLDWILQLTRVGAPGRVETRRTSVRISVARAGKAKKRWKITAIDPVDFFRPL